jgi:hypothetical protein
VQIYRRYALLIPKKIDFFLWKMVYSIESGLDLHFLLENFFVAAQKKN